MFRKLPRFEYLAPRTVKECLAALSERGPSAKVLAGGTDLVPQMRWGEIRPECVISLNHIPDLDEIQFAKKTGLKLGALTRIADIQRSEIIQEYYPLLVQAASVLASSEIRNRATVGGNLCTAAPSADMAPSLLVLGASAVIASGAGERKIPLEDFFAGPKKTVLESDELLLRLEIPAMKPHSAGEYIKFGRRRAMEIALIGVAALLSLDAGEQSCTEARLAFASAAPTPMRAKKSEGVLIGKKLDETVIASAAETASKETAPRTSWRTTEEYRRDLIRALTRRAIERSMQKIQSA